MKKTCALVLLAGLVAGCGKKEEPPPPPPTPVEAPKPPPPMPVAVKTPLAPPLTAAQKSELEKSFVAARELVKQARAFRQQGDAQLKSQGAAAANDNYVKAKDLYKQAAEDTEFWIEPELGKVTEAQIKDYLESYRSERGQWFTENSSMGKVHKD